MTGMLIPEELLAATRAERKREVDRLSQVREARRLQESPARRGRAWAWRAEPGMEDAFRSLRGWLLSSAGQREVRQAASDQGSP